MGAPLLDIFVAGFIGQCGKHGVGYSQLKLASQKVQIGMTGDIRVRNSLTLTKGAVQQWLFP